MKKIDIEQKFRQLEDFFSPKIVGEFNDQSIKISKVEGEFVWHEHEDTDELFFVIDGNLAIELEDQTINLQENEIFIVPKGTEHRPVAEEKAHVLMIESQGTVNTGDVENELTEKNLEEI